MVLLQFRAQPKKLAHILRSVSKMLRTFSLNYTPTPCHQDAAIQSGLLFQIIENILSTGTRIVSFFSASQFSVSKSFEYNLTCQWISWVKQINFYLREFLSKNSATLELVISNHDTFSRKQQEQA